jgi:hypothetical protein
MKKFIYLFLTLCLIFMSQYTVAQVPSYVPTDGLVGYWPFDGNANDASGNGNNGVVNGPTLTSDRFGNNNSAYSFSNNYILVPSSTLFDSNDLTISMWVSSSNIQRQVALIRLTYDNASNEHFGIAFNDNSQYGVSIVAKYDNPNCMKGIGWQKNEEIQNIMDSDFHHIVGAINGNTLKLYIDGLLVNTLISPQSQTSSCWNGDLQIGRNWNQFTDYFQGKIDDIGFWNRPLTQQEITDLYDSVLSTNTANYESNVNIYPNPANDHITIDFGNLDNVEGWNIKIINILGQEVLSQPMNTDKIDVSELTKGIYIIKISDGMSQIDRKFIKN